MNVFLPTLNQMGFLFSLIVIGYLLARFRAVGEGSAGILAKLEKFIFIPALMLGTFMNTFTVEKLAPAWKLMLFSLAVLLLIIPIAFLVARLCAKDDYKRKIYTYAICFSNYGYMGNAVVSVIFPEIFTEYLLFTIVLQIVTYIWAVPALLISDGTKPTLKTRLKTFANPMFIGVAIGMLIGLLQIPVPAFLAETVTTAGNCMSPIAMLLTGMTVASISLKKTFSDVSIYVMSFIRLIVLPLVGIAVFHFLPVPRVYVLCTLCTLAMPLGLNTVVIPGAYGKDTSAASGMILVSHLLSCLTIPLIFMLIT